MTQLILRNGCELSTFPAPEAPFSKILDVQDRPGATDDYEGYRFAALREIFATLQPSHRDLSTDTLFTFSTARVLSTESTRTPSHWRTVTLAIAERGERDSVSRTVECARRVAIFCLSFLIDWASTGMGVGRRAGGVRRAEGTGNPRTERKAHNVHSCRYARYCKFCTPY